MPTWMQTTTFASQSCITFAGAQTADAVRLSLLLRLDHPGDPVPALMFSPPASCLLVGTRRVESDVVEYVVEIPPSAALTHDDLVAFTIAATGIPPCQVELRRARCVLETGLLGDVELDPQTRAALLWLAWGRFSKLVGLKRFTAPPMSRESRYASGHSGNDVLLFRPQLLAPTVSAKVAESSAPAEIVEGAWGGWLLVKAGPAVEIAREFERYETFVKDRLSPFLARTEQILHIRSATEVGATEPRATLISSFVGGDILRTETLEQRIRSAPDYDACKRLIDQTFSVLAAWHRAGRTEPLSEWRWVFHPHGGNWLLFKKFDLTKKKCDNSTLAIGSGNPGGQQDFSRGLRWDIDFISGDHLDKHLLGKGKGLLYHLRTIKAHYALIHGDLNPRNVLCDESNAWLIDFEHVKIAPVLFDFARLEANLRVWCLTLSSGGANVDDAAMAFESHLLDHMHGSEGGLEPIPHFAGSLGADAEELMKISRCVSRIRELAEPYCVREYADQRDYLAVLYLNVLSLLQQAHKGLAPAPNYRLLLGLAWVLEDRLGRVVGIGPYPRQRVPFDPLHLIRTDWLIAPQAPKRVDYFLATNDGPQVFPWLAATKGVAQPTSHHLDVYDHTLLVLAFLEEIFKDPLAAFKDPAQLEAQVLASLEHQGLTRLLQPMHDSPPETPTIAGWNSQLEVGVKDLLTQSLTDAARLRLKWSALLHDVCKPPTRVVTDGRKNKRIQFLGHERYATEVLRPLLEHLFNDATEMTLLKDLLDDHHRANQMIDRYEHNPDFVVELLNDVRQIPDGPRNATEAKFIKDWVAAAGSRDELVIRIVHGLADRMARRGVYNSTTIKFETEIFLAVLALLAFPAVSSTGALKAQLAIANKILQEELKARGLGPKAMAAPRQKVQGRLPELLEQTGGDEEKLRRAIRAILDE